jgi:RNA polymerase sigma-70 factor (ECF subfamily)
MAEQTQDEVRHDIRRTLDHIYREESRRVLATLICLLGDFDRAEDALHDAIRAAAEQWPRDGVPDNPRAWLVSTGRFKAIDALRKQEIHETPLSNAHERTLPGADGPTLDDEIAVADDRLRLIFTCCHPALPPDARAALTLREVCGLTTEAIAHAFLRACLRNRW